MLATHPPSHISRSSRLRIAGWVVVCVWLVVVLLPLRAWAMAGTGVGALDTATAGAVVAELPPCHAAMGDEAHAHGHSACSDCVFCAPMLASTLPSGTFLTRPHGLLPAASAGVAPAGALDPLFKPPRG